MPHSAACVFGGTLPHMLRPNEYWSAQLLENVGGRPKGSGEIQRSDHTLNSVYWRNHRRLLLLFRRSHHASRADERCRTHRVAGTTYAQFYVPTRLLEGFRSACPRAPRAPTRFLGGCCGGCVRSRLTASPRTATETASAYWPGQAPESGTAFAPSSDGVVCSARVDRATGMVSALQSLDGKIASKRLSR